MCMGGCKTSQADGYPLAGDSVSTDGRKRGWFNSNDGADNALRTLELAIFNLGNPHPSLTLAEEIDQLAQQIIQELPDALDQLVNCLLAVILEVPTKLILFIHLLLKMVKDSSENSQKLVEDFMANLIEALNQNLYRALSQGPWRHVSQSLCFFTHAAGRNLIKPIICKTLVDKLVEAALSIKTSGQVPEQAQSNNDGRTLSSSLLSTRHFILWSVGVALVTMPMIPAIKTSMMVRRVLDRLVHDKEIAHVPADVLDVWRVIESSLGQTLNVTDSINQSNDFQVNDDAFKVEIPASLIVDPAWDGEFRHLALFADAFGDSISLAQKWFTFYAGRVLIESMELNHRRCADTLLYTLPLLTASLNDNLDLTNIVIDGSGERITCELLFGELLRKHFARLRGDIVSLSSVVYEILLIDCCRQSKTFPPIMARSLHNIFNNHLLDLPSGAIDRLATWFAHHLSNFDLKWNWVAWEEVCTIDNDKIGAEQRLIQYRFLRSVIQRLTALTYAERVETVLPPTFHHLVPHPHPTRPTDDGLDEKLVDELVRAIGDRRLPADELLKEFSESVNADKGFMMELAVAQLEVGSKSLSHTLAILERYHSLWLKAVLNLGEQRLLTIVDTFWQSSNLHWQYITERFVNYRILSANQVISFCLEQVQISKANTDERYLEYDFIIRILEQSSRMSRYAEQKLQASRVDPEKIQNTVKELKRAHEECVRETISRMISLIQGQENLVAMSLRDLLFDIILLHGGAIREELPSLLEKILDRSILRQLNYYL